MMREDEPLEYNNANEILQSITVIGMSMFMSFLILNLKGECTIADYNILL